MSKLFGRGMEKLSKKNIQPKPDRQGPQNWIIWRLFGMKLRKDGSQKLRDVITPIMIKNKLVRSKVSFGCLNLLINFIFPLPRYQILSNWSMPVDKIESWTETLSSSFNKFDTLVSYFYLSLFVQLSNGLLEYFFAYLKSIYDVFWGTFIIKVGPSSPWFEMF